MINAIMPSKQYQLMIPYTHTMAIPSLRPLPLDLNLLPVPPLQIKVHQIIINSTALTAPKQIHPLLNLGERMTGPRLGQIGPCFLPRPPHLEQIEVIHILEPINPVMAAMHIHKVADEGCGVVVAFVGLLAGAL